MDSSNHSRSSQIALWDPNGRPGLNTVFSTITTHRHYSFIEKLKHLKNTRPPPYTRGCCSFCPSVVFLSEGEWVETKRWSLSSYLMMLLNRFNTSFPPFSFQTCHLFYSMFMLHASWLLVLPPFHSNGDNSFWHAD